MARASCTLAPFARGEMPRGHSRAFVSVTGSGGSRARVHQEMLQGGGCEVRVQGRGRNNEGFGEGGCQGLELCQGRQLVMEKGGAEAWKERKEHPRAEEFTEGCVFLAGREQERDRSGWRSSPWKRELGTGRRGQQHEGLHWDSVRIPSLQAHALKSQSGRRT